jgi:hypothetical protein
VLTPLLERPLPGSVYLAEPFENPFPSEGHPGGSLLAVYLAIEDPERGVVVKLAGHVEANPLTGQLTTTFENDPQIPFEKLQLELFGGPRAPLVTPAVCGSASTTSRLTPWSSETPAAPSDSFTIDEGCAHGFSPSFRAGSTDSQAGVYSPFTLSFSRGDGEQELEGLEQTLPAGLLARLAGVPLCGEAQASVGACPEASQIGTVEVSAGVGADPVSVAGTIYLTGPYNGGPFGEVVEVPAIAGPFDLDEDGRPVTVRGSIRINPTTAQASVVSDPFPAFIEKSGIPADVRKVNVTLDRPGFTFNPTNCEALSITATLTSTQGTAARVSSPFQAAGCAGLPFTPVFAVSTAGKASKADGASLEVKVTSNGGPQPGGGEANIRSVKVDLPKQLPSRLTTLQKACLAAVFQANPASCPKESDVGSATAATPLLSQPLSGPAYLVSHGGAAFPDLEIVLQGEGIKLILDGATDIKKGITSSIFRTLPDAPVSTFELTLPVGPYSALAANVPEHANYSLCGQSLQMPTEITAQNGAVVKQTTKITITGCPKPKPKHKHKKPRKK